jgi:hypothetical protein
MSQNLKQVDILLTSGVCSFSTVLSIKGAEFVWDGPLLFYQLPDDCAKKVFDTLYQMLFVIAVDKCKPYAWKW